MPTILLLLFTIITNQTLANSNIGISLNNSTMNNAPISTQDDSNEYKFHKQSISIYGQKSLLKNTLILSSKTEIINMLRNSMVVNNTLLPQETNSGIRSFDFNASSYLYTVRGWREYFQIGYNLKGIMQNDTIRFAIPNNEYGLGIMFIKDKKPRGVITPIIQGMLNTSQHTIKKFEINTYYGQDYRFLEMNGLIITPLLQQINAKIFYKYKQYSFSNDAPIFINENKIITGIILKNHTYNALEFDLYHDFISNEFGASIGFSYYIKEKQDSIQHKMLNYYEKRYLKNKKTSNVLPNKQTEIEEAVEKILEERGF